MTAADIVIVMLGALAGGFVNGLAGFGTALFALGFWLQVMPPVQAVSVVLVMSVASGVQGLWVVRRSIAAEPARLMRFLLPGLLGIPLGIRVLHFVDPSVLKLTIATIMLLYGILFLARRGLPPVRGRFYGVDVVVGFLGGVLGGAASLSGALPTMWGALRPWSKGETRAVLQAFNVAILGSSAVVLAFQGVYDPATLTRIAVAVPVSILAARIGIAVFHRLGDRQFRTLIVALMFLSGLGLMARELLA